MRNIPNGIFAERLSLLIKETGLSQMEFAFQVGVKQPAISKYLSGRVPKGIQLLDLARYLNVSPDWLVGLSDTRDCHADSRAIIKNQDVTAPSNFEINSSEKLKISKKHADREGEIKAILADLESLTARVQRLLGK